MIDKISMGTHKVDMLKYAQYYEDLANPFASYPNADEIRASVETLGDRSIHIKALFNRKVWPLIVWANEIVGYILISKVIPAQHLKAFTRLSKVVTKVTRAPNKPYAWWVKNGEDLACLIDMERWKDKDEVEDIGLVQKIKGFTIINEAPKLKEQDFEGILTEFKQALTLMERSSVIHAKDLFYGDCVVITDLHQKSVLAWYSVNQDAIYIKGSKGLDRVHTIIHELGHRLWFKFLTAQQKKDWTTWHYKCAYAKKDVTLPQVGDELPFPIRGIKGKPKVIKIEAGNYFVTETGFMSLSQIISFYRSIALFPSQYASTDAEEHFSEAFAFYCEGSLKDEHLANFDFMFKR